MGDAALYLLGRAQIKRRAFGVYCGLRPKRLRACLTEFVFPWDRRYLRKTSPDNLLDIVGRGRRARCLLTIGTACVFLIWPAGSISFTQWRIFKLSSGPHG